MIHNGHAPEVVNIGKPRSVLEATDNLIQRYRIGLLDVTVVFEKVRDLITQFQREYNHAKLDNKRLADRNTHLEAEIARVQNRLQHMSYTPRYLSKGEIAAFPRAQYVYLLHDIEVTGRYKIGKAALPSSRFTKFTKWPFRWQVVCILATKDMHTLEQKFHDQYKHKRSLGTEWFDLEPHDVLDIVTYSEE